MTPDIDAFIVEESVKYKGLSLRDTSRKVVAEMGETGQVMKVAWMMEIEKAIIAAKEEAAKIERARCLEMISRCVKVYQGYGQRAEARDKGEDPTFYPTVKAEDSWAKATGAEYAHFVVGDWSLSENFRDDQMPMPF